MSIQNLEPAQIGQKLSLRWVNMTDFFHSVFLEVAENSEFTKQARMFLLPRCVSAELDVGGGFWYVRAGVPKGDTNFGSIEWTAVIGPVLVVSPKQPPPFTKSFLTITNLQQMTNGIRVHVKGYDGTCHLLAELSEKGFQSSLRKTIYTYDGVNNHYFDIPLTESIKSYNVRMWGFLTWPTETIEMVGEWIQLPNVRAIPPNRAATKRVTNTDVTQFSSYTGMAHDEKTTVLRFTSQQDYARWLTQKNKHIR